MYDYVIVGAGSAGCVLANRLSEDPSVTVLLLEAGEIYTKQEVRIPAAFGKLFKTACDWDYETEPQAQLDNRALYWPRGRMLGGSSTLNAMMYLRGNRADYDAWQAAGNTGWGYEDVLPYFKKSEHFERGASEYHGVNGTLNVADPRSPNPLTRVFIDAAAEIGIPRNNDFAGAQQEGVGLLPLNQKHGQRCSAVDAFIQPIRHRANLTIQTNALAQQILFAGKRATGIRYLREGKTEQALANREVILCGGTINSPQLLLLSGIGPASQLQNLEIPVVLDLAGVGQNLHDHVAAPVCYTCTKPITLAGTGKWHHLLNYILFRRGPLTSNIGEAAVFQKTKPGLIAPDLEILFGPAYFLVHGFENPPGHGYTFGFVLLNPQSRGHLALRSSDPSQAPLINPNYLEAEADRQLMLEGLKVSRRLGQAHAFDGYRGEEFLPGPQVQSDEELLDFIRLHSDSLYHPVGTCKMGNDEMAVVDEELRIHGIEHLRVVDASIMPTLVRGHTNAPTMMIAEKAADLIKQRSVTPTVLRATR